MSNRPRCFRSFFFSSSASAVVMSIRSLGMPGIALIAARCPPSGPLDQTRSKPVPVCRRRLLSSEGHLRLIYRGDGGAGSDPARSSLRSTSTSKTGDLTAEIRRAADEPPKRDRDLMDVEKLCLWLWRIALDAADEDTRWLAHRTTTQIVNRDVLVSGDEDRGGKWIASGVLDGRLDHHEDAFSIPDPDGVADDRRHPRHEGARLVVVDQVEAVRHPHHPRPGVVCLTQTHQTEHDRASCHRVAQVRRAGGVSSTADSSMKQSQVSPRTNC
jgi:hypothetical protein